MFHPFGQLFFFAQAVVPGRRLQNSRPINTPHASQDTPAPQLGAQLVVLHFRKPQPLCAITGCKARKRLSP
jgi:hypothetical protein